MTDLLTTGALLDLDPTINLRQNFIAFFLHSFVEMLPEKGNGYVKKVREELVFCKGSGHSKTARNMSLSMNVLRCPYLPCCLYTT